MRSVVTRVKSASVSIDGEVKGAIGQGFLVLLGVGPEDTEATADKLAEKICNVRVFSDEAGKMNLSLDQVQGDMLIRWMEVQAVDKIFHDELCTMKSNYLHRMPLSHLLRSLLCDAPPARRSRRAGLFQESFSSKADTRCCLCPGYMLGVSSSGKIPGYVMPGIHSLNTLTV